jgi:hypothetical protein
MRFFVAKDAPQNDGGFLAVCEFGRRFALEKLWRGRLWKSGAEPPHSTLGRASRQTRTLRDNLLMWVARFAGGGGFGWARRRSFVASLLWMTANGGLVALVSG